MDLNLQKEEFSRAWLAAVAAAAGYSVEPTRVDNDSIDATIVAGSGPLPSRPCIQVQLKCTADDVMRSDGLHFPLPVKNYDDLRANTKLPRILVVLRVPADPPDWWAQTPTEMVLQHCAWWASLRGNPSTSNTTTQTVILPIDQIVTPEALTSLLSRVDAGSWP